MFRTQPLGLNTATGVFLLAFLVQLSASRHSFAQTQDTPPHQRAQLLFDEARRLMEQGAFVQACPELQASYELDPATGTLLNLAFCLESLGSTVAAYRTYRAAQQRAVDERNDERMLFAAERIKLLDSKLVRIVFPEAAREAGFWVKCNDEQATLPDGDVGCVVEPGLHRVVYGAPGKMPNALNITASEPGREFVVTLRALIPVGPVQHARVADQSRPPTQPATVHRGELGDATAATISLGIAAVAALGTTYLGWRAKSEWDERNRHCSSGCDERALSAGERANDFAWAANVTGVVAVLSAGVGAYFLVRRKPVSSVTALSGALTLGQGGALLTATFVR